MSINKIAAAQLMALLAINMGLGVGALCPSAGAKQTPNRSEAKQTSKRNEAKQTPKSSEAKPTIKLYGSISELEMLCSSAGIKLSAASAPANVSRVSLGSAASFAGIREGDRVLSARPDGSQLVLDIERKGKRYQAAVATDVYGLKEQFERRGIKWSIGENLFDDQLSELSKCNIVVMLDRSESMQDNHAGCPGDMTKWNWCRQQLDGLYFATARLLEDGFDLVPFGNDFQRFNNVTLWDLRNIFERYRPQGTRKDIAAPLESVLTDRARWQIRKDKPLVVMVLTDGTRNTGRPLEHVLIEASNKVGKTNDVSIVFLQVGDSVIGDQLFSDLEQNLVAKGARYHMVIYKPFSELRQRGLLSELLSAVRETLKKG